jgi:hypothetical protein
LASFSFVRQFFSIMLRGPIIPFMASASFAVWSGCILVGSTWGMTVPLMDVMVVFSQRPSLTSRKGACAARTAVTPTTRIDDEIVRAASMKPPGMGGACAVSVPPRGQVLYFNMFLQTQTC